MPSDEKYRVWECKLYVPADVELPQGADWPMRFAVRNAFEGMIEPYEYDYDIFSGWGGSVDECEVAVIENREPDLGDNWYQNTASDIIQKDRDYWNQVAIREQSRADALEAHVAHLNLIVIDLLEKGHIPTEHPVILALDSGPETGLAKLIAEKQAEELYAMAEHNLEHADIYAYNGDQERSEECLRFHDVLKARADELKRESERKGV